MLQKYFPTSIRLTLPLAVSALLISGCAGTPGEVRYDGTTRQYTVGQNDGATEYQNSKKKRYTVGQYDDATAHYRLKKGKRGYFTDQDGVTRYKTPYSTEQLPHGSSSDSLQGSTIVLDIDDILFDFDKAVIRSAYLPELDRWAEFFINNPEVKAEIHGHADSTGPEPYNQKLSERRANAIITYLIGKGVEGNRLTAVGFGETLPVAPNTSKEGRQQNRRVEMKFE